MSERTKSGLTFLASLVVILGVWEYISRSGGVNPLVVPAPSSIAAAIWFVLTNLFSNLAYWQDTWITLYEIVFGFLLGSGAAIVIGSLVAEFATARRIVIPYTIALNSTPKIAIAPPVRDLVRLRRNAEDPDRRGHLLLPGIRQHGHRPQIHGGGRVGTDGVHPGIQMADIP